MKCAELTDIHLTNSSNALVLTIDFLPSSSSKPQLASEIAHVERLPPSIISVDAVMDGGGETMEALLSGRRIEGLKARIVHFYPLASVSFHSYILTNAGLPFRRHVVVMPRRFVAPIVLLGEVQTKQRKNPPKFGNFSAYARALDELSISNSDEEVRRVADKYNFPIEFLRESFEVYEDTGKPEMQAKMQSAFVSFLGQAGIIPRAANGQADVGIRCEIDRYGASLLKLLGTEGAKWASILNDWNAHGDEMISTGVEAIKGFTFSYMMVGGFVALIPILFLLAWAYFGFDVTNFVITTALGGVLSLIAWFLRGAYDNFKKVKQLPFKDDNEPD